MPRDRGTPAMTRQWSFDLTQQQEQGRGGWRHCEHGEMLYGRENGVSKVTCWSPGHYGQTAGATLTRVSLPTWQASLLRRERPDAHFGLLLLSASAVLQTTFYLPDARAFLP